MECHSAEAGDVDAICQSLDMAGCQASTDCFYDMEDMECTPNSELDVIVVPPRTDTNPATTAAATAAASTAAAETAAPVETDAPVEPDAPVETDAPVATT